jgi:hypothetical protein
LTRNELMNGALEARLVMALRQAGRLTVGAGLVSDAPEFSLGAATATPSPPVAPAK